MIDWNSALTTTRTTKATNEATAKANLEAKQAEELAEKIAYQQACVKFDSVIAEQLSGIKTFLASYSNFTYDTSSTGFLKIVNTRTVDGHPEIDTYTLAVIYGNNIDVLTNTVTRLQSFITNIIVYDLGL